MTDRRIENGLGKKRRARGVLALFQNALEKAAAVSEATCGKGHDEARLGALRGAQASQRLFGRLHEEKRDGACPAQARFALPAIERGIFLIHPQDRPDFFRLPQGCHIHRDRLAVEKRIDANARRADRTLTDNREIDFHAEALREKTSAAFEPPKPRLTLMTCCMPVATSFAPTRAPAISGIGSCKLS